MDHIIIEKSKRIYVPASGNKKAYWRYDPRIGVQRSTTEKVFEPKTKVIYHSESSGEKIINALKDILKKIGVMKEKGAFTKEQKAHIRKKLEGLEPRIKHFKQQKQRAEVSKIMKEIRKELGSLEKKPHESLKPKKTKKQKQLSEEIVGGIKKLGYTDVDIDRMTEHEAKAVYYNDIHK